MQSDVGPSPLRVALEERLEHGELDLPMLPQTAQRVLEVAQRDDVNASTLAQLIEQDPTMAARLLRVSNSSAYAPQEPIVSLQQAVARLGLQTVRAIAFASAAQSTLFTSEFGALRIAGLWRHSAAAAAWARTIARARRRNVEGAFLCTLLHDVGKPVIFTAVNALAQEFGTTVSNEEREAWACELHGAAGARLLETWELPAWMANVVRHHHDPANAGEQVEEAATTQLADLLALWGDDADEQAALALAQHPVLDLLGLYSDELEELLAQRDAVESLVEALA
jgi:putative nucleotidyltransferase with HDIG domain